MLNDAQLQSYQRARTNGGYVELPPRCHIEFRGSDRAAFLHNFCTADIKGMQSGSVSELFILDGRGKTISFGHVFAFEDKLVVSTADSDQAASLVEHLDKYIFREEVTLEDKSNEVSSFYVFGHSPVTFANPDSLGKNRCSVIVNDNATIELANIELAQFGFLLTFSRDEQNLVHQQLANTELEEIDFEVYDVYRVECGTPVYGKEIDGSNLPQELRRDDKAISFTKGCYLGQETVAKIDAFGHVNKFLAGLQFDERPDESALLKHDDKKAGQLRTVVYSAELECWLGLAYVKCKLAAVGTQLTTESNITGTIIQLPIF